MPELVGFMAALAAVYCGFALMALAMTRHWRQAMGTQAAERQTPRSRAALTLRICGVALIVMSLILLTRGSGPGFGTLLWILSLSIGGYSVVATLALRPAWLRPIARRC